MQKGGAVLGPMLKSQYCGPKVGPDPRTALGSATAKYIDLGLHCVTTILWR